MSDTLYTPRMPGSPLAYHITFGTYGTRLHGDPRGTVHHAETTYGQPIIGRNDLWQQIEHTNLKFHPILLTPDQRRFIQNALPTLCERGNWSHHRTAAQPDHIHILLASPRPPKPIRRCLKRWLTQALSDQWPLSPGQSWWAEGGSIKWIWDLTYFYCVDRYIRDQRYEP